MCSLPRCENVTGETQGQPIVTGEMHQLCPLHQGILVPTPWDKPQDPAQFLPVLFQLWDAWPLWTHQGSSEAQILKHIFL